MILTLAVHEVGQAVSLWGMANWDTRQEVFIEQSKEKKIENIWLAGVTQSTLFGVRRPRVDLAFGN